MFYGAEVLYCPFRTSETFVSTIFYILRVDIHPQVRRNKYFPGLTNGNEISKIKHILVYKPLMVARGGLVGPEMTFLGVF